MNAESFQLEKFGERDFRDGNEVIPEIPVCTRDILDVGTKTNEQPVMLQATVCFCDSTFNTIFIRKVFKKIAGKHDV